MALTPEEIDGDLIARSKYVLLSGTAFSMEPSRSAMFRLKEHWSYLLCRFEGWEKLGKRLRKTTSLEEYRAITHEIFTTLPLAPALTPNW